MLNIQGKAMEYLVTFYEEGSDKPQIKAKHFMSARDVLILYERMIHIERNEAQILNYPSKLFEVYKLNLVTDNS